jgi:CRP-like cAMP-binding protein
MSKWEEIEPERKEQLAKALAKVDLLAQLAPEQITRLLDEARIRNYEKGEVILFKGEISQSLLIVGSGSAIVCLKKDEKIIEGGDYFAEMSLFLERPLSATSKQGPTACACWPCPAR